MTTVAGIDEYKGNITFAIHKLDEEGNKGKFPVFSFGLTKAQALLNHMDDFEQWCIDQKLQKKELDQEK